VGVPLRQTIVAETPNLWLRFPTWDDADFFAALHADPAVMRYIGRGMPRPPEESRRWLASWIDEAEGRAPDWLYRAFPRLRGSPHPFGMWALARKRDGERVGRVGLLAQLVDDAWEVEVTYILARSHWGRGYATEAARAAAEVALNRHALPRVLAIIQPANTPAQRVAAKIGMTHEKDTVFKEVPVRVYAMARRDDAGGPVS
jgi:RimJ/RimL family protein N-acetyltransferase